MIAEKLLSILRCPESRQTLRLADASTVAAINEQIGAGSLNNRSGQKVAERIDGGLIREDGKFLYPIRAKIPVMLIDEAIAV